MLGATAKMSILTKDPGDKQLWDSNKHGDSEPFYDWNRFLDWDRFLDWERFWEVERFVDWERSYPPARAHFPDPIVFLAALLENMSNDQLQLKALSGWEKLRSNWKRSTIPRIRYILKSGNPYQDSTLVENSPMESIDWGRKNKCSKLFSVFS